MLISSISLLASNCRIFKAKLIPVGKAKVVDFVSIVGKTDEGYLIIKNDKGEIEDGQVIVTYALVMEYILLKKDVDK